MNLSLSQIRDVLWPTIAPEDRGAVEETLAEENARRGRFLAILLFFWFGANIVIDLLVFVPQGKHYYLYLDVGLILVTGAAVPVYTRAHSSLVVRRATSVFVGILILWAAVISSIGESPVTLLLVSMVSLTLLFVPTPASAFAIVAGVSIYIVFADHSAESLTETIALSFWALIMSRTHRVSRMQAAVAEQELNRVVTEQEGVIENRTRDLERLLRDREFLLREVHHRVKNNLQVIISLLHLAARDGGSAMAETESRLVAMVLAHEYLHDSEHLERIDASRYLGAVVAQAMRRRRPDGQTVIRTEIPSALLPIDRAVPLGLAVSELVGLFEPDGSSETETITLSGTRDCAGLSVQIFGAGLFFRRPDRGSLSATLVEATVGQLGAELLLDPTVEIRLPISDAAEP